MSKEKTEGKRGTGRKIGSCGTDKSILCELKNPLNRNAKRWALRSNPASTHAQHILLLSQPCGPYSVSGGY